MTWVLLMVVVIAVGVCRADEPNDAAPPPPAPLASGGFAGGPTDPAITATVTPPVPPVPATPPVPGEVRANWPGGVVIAHNNAPTYFYSTPAPSAMAANTPIQQPTQAAQLSLTPMPPVSLVQAAPLLVAQPAAMSFQTAGYASPLMTTARPRPFAFTRNALATACQRLKAVVAAPIATTGGFAGPATSGSMLVHTGSVSTTTVAHSYMMVPTAAPTVAVQMAPQAPQQQPQQSALPTPQQAPRKGLFGLGG